MGGVSRQGRRFRLFRRYANGMLVSWGPGGRAGIDGVSWCARCFWTGIATGPSKIHNQPPFRGGGMNG